MSAVLVPGRPLLILSGRRLLVALGIWLLSSAAVGGATVLTLRALASGSATDSNTIAAIIVAEVYALLIGALAFALRPRFRELVALQPCTARDFALAALACATAYAVTGAIQSAIAPRSWTATLALLRGIFSDDGRLASAGPIMTGLILLRACILAALGEELLFRGALFAWIRPRLSATTTIAITSAAFAAIHGFPLVFPLTFAVGIGFGWIRERSGSTVPCIVVHAVHNALMITLAYALTGWTARLPQWGVR